MFSQHYVSLELRIESIELQYDRTRRAADELLAERRIITREMQALGAALRCATDDAADLFEAGRVQRIVQRLIRLRGRMADDACAEFGVRLRPSDIG